MKRNRKNGLIDLYILSGGIPKYIDFFIDSGFKDFERFIKGFLFENSPLLEEGKFSLIEEFGKKYSILFGECKLNKAKGKINQLMGKTIELEREFKTYRKIYKLFYPEMIDDILEDPGRALFDD